jgi:hypothetical protein
MSLLTEASLVITPNAVEEGKLFSIIPTDGSGDLTVTRATTATRVNSDGLIEEVPYNLASYSEQFESTSWIKQSTTIVQDFAISPNGTEDADLCYPNSDGNFRGFRQLNTTSTGLRAKSIFAKQSGKSKFFIRFDNGAYVTFDLENGTIFQNTTGYVATIEDYGNGWYRCYAQSNIETSATSMYIAITDSSGYPSVTANGTDGILFWGAQDESGSLKEYFPTTDRLNVPRLDYTNSSCPSILVEPQRTNLLLRSEEFENASWGTLGTITITPNNTIAPDGNNSADLILGDNANSAVFQTYSGSIGVVYTSSFFIKNNNSTQSKFLIRNASTVVDAILNWTGSVLSSITNTIGITTFQSYNNGWYRISSTYTSVEAPQRPRIYPTLSTNQSVYLWGAQLEAGSNATSYIPTVGSTVTRNADVISKTGIADLIGQTEGTIYAECNFKNANASAKYISVNNGTNNNRISFVLQGNGTLLILEMAINGTVLANVVLKNLSNLNLFLKIALKYKSGEIKCFVDGQLLFSNNLTYSNAILDRLLLTNPTGGQRFDGNINSIQLYKTALTDEQCISLTTL